MANNRELFATEFDRTIERLSGQGVYYIPPGAILSHCQLAAMEGMSHRSVMDNIVYEGLRCRKVGHGYFVRSEALSDWVKDGEQIHVRPRRNPRCTEDPPSNDAE